jgi:uncharacterized OsmC-like protein
MSSILSRRTMTGAYRIGDQMADNPKEHEFEIILEAIGRSVGKMRSEITVSRPGSSETYEMATDEGDFHGGDGTAPPPLSYFATAFTACLMTQIRAFSKRLDIPINGVVVKGHYRWIGRQTGRDPYVGSPGGFSFDIDVDSDASTEDLVKLIEAAKKGCFIDQTMAVANDVGHRLKVGDDWLEV